MADDGWYLRYSLSFRDVEELLSERGLEADPELAAAAQRDEERLVNMGGKILLKSIRHSIRAPKS